MDSTVAPGDDFNAYTNGGWAKVTEIPADKSSYGPWAVVYDRTLEQTQTLIRELAAGRGGATAGGADGQKIGDFFADDFERRKIDVCGLVEDPLGELAIEPAPQILP